MLCGPFDYGALRVVIQRVVGPSVLSSGNTKLVIAEFMMIKLFVKLENTVFIMKFE